MFQQRKNKRYSYSPRHGETKENSQSSHLSDKWKEARIESTGKRKRGWSVKLLIVILIILLVGMYYLDKMYM